LRDRDTGRSLTPRPGLALALGPAVRAGLVVLHLLHPGDRVDLMGRVVLPGPVVLHLGDRVDLMGRAGLVVLHRLRLAALRPVHLGDRVDLMGLAVLHLLGRAVLHLVAMGPVVRVAPVDLTSRVVRVAPVELTSRVVRVAPVDRVELTSRAAPADPLVLVGPADLVGPDLTVPVDRAAQVDRRRRLHRRTSKRVSTTGVARSGVAPGTHRTDSARRIMARRRRRGNADSGGTVDLLPELRRLTGTAHRLLAVGTGRHLLAAGTPDGMGRLAT
jgi:hypothetical protein